MRALRDAGLSDAATLHHYPRTDGTALEEMFGWGLVGASSDATSSGTATSTYGHQVYEQVLEWCGRMGGDPKTVQASLRSQGGDPITDQAALRSLGGDPKTDHEALKTDSGGDPKTDHSLCMNAHVGGDSPRLGRGGAGNPNCPFLSLFLLT